jgi:hypothetical protein
LEIAQRDRLNDGIPHRSERVNVSWPGAMRGLLSLSMSAEDCESKPDMLNADVELGTHPGAHPTPAR